MPQKKINIKLANFVSYEILCITSDNLHEAISLSLLAYRRSSRVYFSLIASTANGFIESFIACVSFGSSLKTKADSIGFVISLLFTCPQRSKSSIGRTLLDTSFCIVLTPILFCAMCSCSGRSHCFLHKGRRIAKLVIISSSVAPSRSMDVNTLELKQSSRLPVTLAIMALDFR